MPVFWAAVLATVFFPVQSRYVVALGGRRSLAAQAAMAELDSVISRFARNSARGVPYRL